MLPPGKALSGLQVGDLSTQTDVKNRWDDGSIRFAVVMALIPQPGAFPLREQGSARGALACELPPATVRLALGADVYRAALPSKPNDDLWLTGPLVVERQFVVAPRTNQKRPVIPLDASR